MNWNWVLQTITMLLVGAIGFFIKGTMTEIKQKIGENDAEIKRVEKELGTQLNDLKCDLPFIYTTREDFATAMNAVDKKLSKMDENIDKKMDMILERLNKGVI